jgi:2-polyprenyl-3-methyl-5-hydroxy-6-metoxy-1,4-benzoquinol methylase
MTGEEQPVNTDPASIMDQIRRRVLEIASRRKARDAQISSLLENMSEGIGSPWREEPLATFYPFPLKPLALKIRAIIQAEIRWTFEHFIQEQRRLNLSGTAAIRSVWESSKEGIRRLEEENDQIHSAVESSKEGIRRLEEENDQIHSAVESSKEGIDHLTEEVHRIRPSNICGFRYAAFEETARGTSALIRSRQATYVDHFQGRTNVLDVGCGRGEFLELLKEHGIQAYGIDSSSEMLKIAASCGLQVLKDDALQHLRGLKDACLGGLFCSQVIEHMGAAEASEFVQLAFRKMMPGSKIIIETVNPTSVLALSEFFGDPTHTKPVHPNTLRFMLESAGFVSVRIEYCNEPAGERLEKIKSDGASLVPINRNFEKLNRLLWGPMDYAAIGTR